VFVDTEDESVQAQVCLCL